MDFSDIIGNVDTFAEPEKVLDTDKLFSGRHIRLDETSENETPENDEWYYDALFSEDLYGETKVWQIGYENNNLKIVSGILIDANNIPAQKLDIEYIPTHDPLKDARKLFLSLYSNKYYPAFSESYEPVKPMLCKTYKHHRDLSKPKSSETRIKKFPVSVMRKLHGIRGLVKANREVISIRSRECNELPHLDHIRNEMKIFLKYLPPGSELDGELYSHELSFNQITSAVKTTKTVHQNNINLKFWIFDLIEPCKLPWETRYSILVNAYTKYLEDGNQSLSFTILQAYNVHNYQELDTYLDTFVKEGYEGLTIRRYACVEKLEVSQYKSGRNINLIKYKMYQDKEGIINSHDGDMVTVDGHDYKIKLDFVPDGDIIGQKLTYRYYADRDPIGIAIRDYE